MQRCPGTGRIPLRIAPDTMVILISIEPIRIYSNKQKQQAQQKVRGHWLQASDDNSTTNTARPAILRRTQEEQTQQSD